LSGYFDTHLRELPGSPRIFEIDQRFPDCNRDRDPDQKPFRKKTVIDFHFEFDQRFLDQNRILIFILKSISD